MFALEVFPPPSSRSFSDQLRMHKKTDFQFEKKLNFRQSLNWINFFLIWHVSPPNTEYSWALIFLNHLFWKCNRYLKYCLSPCLAGCKNKYKLSNQWLNTQIVWHVDKFRVFFYWSCDHGRGMMMSYLGSLVYKSWKLTKILPNSLKLLDHYILSNVP